MGGNYNGGQSFFRVILDRQTDAMPPAASPDITRLLRAWRSGDAQALERLTPLVYGELRRIAHCHMAGERPGLTLQTDRKSVV